MRIRVIDIGSMIEKAIDINFIDNFFTQSDFVVPSFELQQKFYRQIYRRRKNDHEFDAVRSFNYYNFASNEFYMDGCSSNAFQISVRTPMSTGMGADDNSVTNNANDQAPKNQYNVAQELAPFFRLSSARSNSNHEHLAFAYSSMGMTQEAFYASDMKTTAYVSTVSVDTTKCLKTKVHSLCPSYTTRALVTGLVTAGAFIMFIIAAIVPGGAAVVTLVIGLLALTTAIVFDCVAQSNTQNMAAQCMNEIRNDFYYKQINGQYVYTRDTETGALTKVTRLTNVEICGFIENNLAKYDKNVYNAYR